MKKQFWFIAGMTLCLFFIGLLISPIVLKLTEKIIGEEIVGFTTSAKLVPAVSLGLLLAFCSVCAGCLLWAYSRNNSEATPKLVYGLGLLISIIAAAIAIGFELLYIRYALQVTGENLNNIPMSMDAMNYFSWGFGLTLFVNVVIIAFLLWFQSLKQRQSNSVPVRNN